MTVVDSDPNVGVGLPYPGGTPSPPPFSLPFTPPVRTILPLARYAQIMGINPIQFMSGIAPTYFPDTGCSDRWRQYDWQDEVKVSRDAIAREIQRAERDIAGKLGYWPGQVWVINDTVPYPKYHRHELTALYGHTPKGLYKGLALHWGKFIQGGTKEATLVGGASVSGGHITFSDEDSDGFDETVTIVMSTSVTDPYEIGVFYSGSGGDERFEIRPVRYKTISGGVVTITMDSWLLFKPELLGALPGTSSSNLDIPAEDSGSYVTGVDIYRIYNDPEDQCTLYWDGAPGIYCSSCDGSGCPSCDPITQIACTSARNPDEGIVTVMPASSYDSGTFVVGSFCTGREPERLIANYRSGLLATPHGNSTYEVPHELALAITYMATARLSRPLCTDCENVRQREKELARDLSIIQRGEIGEIQFVTKEVMTCPFGTRYGELEAWRIVKSRKATGDFRVNVALA